MRTESGRGWTLHCVDCLQWVAEQREASVDHVICDPPYDARTHRHARTMRRRSPGLGSHDDGLAGRKLTIDFDPIEPLAIGGHLVGLSRRWAIAFCALEQVGEYANAAGKSWVRACVWVRPDGAPQFTGDRPAQSCEGVAVMHRAGRKRWNGGGTRGHWIVPTVHPRLGHGGNGGSIDERVHPTQKPLPLMLELVRLFTDPDELICDPFAGSGTTGVACIQSGRRFVGCEMNETYFGVACERLRAAERDTTVEADRTGQVPLFGEVGQP